MPKDKDLFTQSVDLVRKGDFKAARSILDKIIEQDPKNIQAYVTRGRVSERLNLLDDARKDYNKAIELKPDEAVAYFRRANVYSNFDRLDDALADLNKAAELAPQKTNIYLVRAEVYAELNQPDKALADYNKAIQLEPQNPYLYYRLGEFFEDTGKPDEALYNYNEAIKLAVQNKREKATLFLLYLSRAKLYAKTSHPAEELSDYDRLIALMPDYIGPYLERAEFYKRQGKLDLALADTSKAVELKPDHHYGYFLTGLIFFDRKNYPGAVKSFEATLKCANISRGRIKPLMEFYLNWAKGLSAYYINDDLNQALTGFSQAKGYLSQLVDWKGKEPDFAHIVGLLEAYIRLIPLDSALKQLLSEPDKLPDHAEQLDGLRESFSGMLKLSDGNLAERDTLLQSKRDICRLLLPLAHPQGIKLSESGGLMDGIKEALVTLKYEHTEELMRILKENRQKLESTQSFTPELVRAGAMADGMMTFDSTSGGVGAIVVDKLGRELIKIPEEEEIELSIDPTSKELIPSKIRRKFRYIMKSTLGDERAAIIESAKQRAASKTKPQPVNIAGIIKELRKAAGLDQTQTPPEVAIHFADPRYKVVRIETKIDKWVVVGAPEYRLIEDLGFAPLQGGGQKVSTEYLIELANRGQLKTPTTLNKSERRQAQNRLSKAMERLNDKLKELFGLETDPVCHTGQGVYKPLLELVPYRAPEVK